MTHVEMIIDYITDGTDFQYSDNHGILTRCRECKYGKWDIGDRGMYCGRRYVELDTTEDFFCAAAERREVSK